MNNKKRKCLDRVTQLDSRNLPKISGICVINGIERPVAAFEVPKGIKASELAKVLLKQAYTEREYQLTDWMVKERENDGMETVKVSMGEL